MTSQTQEIELFLYANQVEMAEINRRIVVFVCGRRFGKSAVLRVRRIKRCMEIPGCEVWYVAHLYALAYKEYEIMKANKAFMGLVARHRTQPYPTFFMKNGSIMSFRSFEYPDSLLGAGVIELQLDEAQKSSYEDVQRVIMPILMDTPDSTLVYSGTLRGKSWLWEECEKGRNPKNQAQMISFVRKTVDSGWVKERGGMERYLGFRAEMPEAIAQEELDCIPMPNQHGVFNHLDRVLSDVPFVSTPVQDHVYIVSADIGRVKDPTCVVVLDVETGLIPYVEKFPLGTDHTDLAKKVKNIAARWNNAHVTVDATGGAAGGHNDSYIPIYKNEMPKRFHEHIWHSSTKASIVEFAVLQVEQRQVTIPKVHREFVQQMREYECRVSQDRRYYAAPRNKHDDYTAAFIQALAARRSGNYEHFDTDDEYVSAGDYLQ